MTNDSAAASARAAGLVTVQLGADLKREWVQWCADRGLVPGRVIRRLVESAVRAGLEGAVGASVDRVAVVVGGGPDEGPKVGREVYFTPSEIAAIAAAASAQGFGFQEWVVAAVRGALAKAPTYGQIELQALVASNLELARLVQDLASVRRLGVHESLAEQIAMLERLVRAHVDLVSRVMAQGARRWQLTV